MKKIIILCFFVVSVFSESFKIKNEVNVLGVRKNFLIGYGIVVGLNGSGDGTTTAFTLLSIANMLKKMGIYINPKDIKSKNAAAVIVTAKMPPMAKSGMGFDVTVASLGDAKDIGNGVLIRTPLFGPDKKVYGFAQGSVSTGGGFSESNIGGKIQKNFTTTGVIVDGGIIERDLPFNFNKLPYVTLTLKHPDFSLARNIAEKINSAFDLPLAKAKDLATVIVSYPKEADRVDFISKILELKVSYKSEPTVVIYERTGTVIMSGDIKIDAPVYVSHGNIYVAIQKEEKVSQPSSFGGGNTAVTQSVVTNVQEEFGRVFSIKTPSLDDLVKALNELGISPRDLIAILQAIKKAGKLHAKIVVM